MVIGGIYMEYYIFISNDCNLNCNYCSILLKKGKCNIPQEPAFSVAELNNFIDKTQRKYNDKSADIVFFGGEPTLNYPFIEKIISSQDSKFEKPYEYHYMLHTNGLLLGEIPDNILKHLDSIMLSINYDKIPRLKLNEGYFKTIINSVRIVKQRKPIPIVARLTITEETSLYSEIALFNPFFDAVYWQIENNYQFKDFKAFRDSYKYELTLCFNIWLNYLKRGIMIRLIPFLAATYFFVNEHNSDVFCCGYNNSMVYVQTNGSCYTCAEDMTTNKNLVGNITDDIQFNAFGPKDVVCKDCSYLKICMGRCGRMHKEFSSEHIREYCELNQILFDLVEKNLKDIQEFCKKYNVVISLDDPIYHFTEYTP